MGVLALDLFQDQIDKDKTAKRADWFLTDYFNDIRRTAGATATDLSSPLLDPSGVINHSHLNNQDMKFLHNAEQWQKIEAAQRILAAIIAAIKACPNGNKEPYLTILYKKYIKVDFDTNVYTEMGYSKSRYYDFKKDALVVFAQILPAKLFKFAPAEMYQVPNLLVKKQKSDAFRT